MKSPSDDIIARLTTVYGEPRSEDPVAYVREVRAALVGWDAATLNETANRLIKVSKFWPRPAEIIEIAESIVSARVVPSGPIINSDWTKTAFLTANQLIRSDMGRQAAAEGWIGQLHVFCRRHRQLPNAREISDLKVEAKMFDEAYAACVAGNGGVLNNALLKLGDSFVANRHSLADIANGGPE